MVFNYTGFELCLDFCENQLESIHFGEDEVASCHIDDCCSLPASDCCDSEQIEIEPQQFDYILTTNLNVKLPVFENSTYRVFEPMVKVDKLGFSVSNEFSGLFRSPIRSLTQVTLC